jgi:hypothetical protein
MKNPSIVFCNYSYHKGIWPALQEFPARMQGFQGFSMVSEIKPCRTGGNGLCGFQENQNLQKPLSLSHFIWNCLGGYSA